MKNVAHSIALVDPLFAVTMRTLMQKLCQPN